MFCCLLPAGVFTAGRVRASSVSWVGGSVAVFVALGSWAGLCDRCVLSVFSLSAMGFPFFMMFPVCCGDVTGLVVSRFLGRGQAGYYFTEEGIWIRGQDTGFVLRLLHWDSSVKTWVLGGQETTRGGTRSL